MTTTTTPTTTPARPHRPPGGGRRRHIERLERLRPPADATWTVLHALSLGAAAVVLLLWNRNQWFFGDEWNFIVNRAPGLSDTDIFRPHNEHWTAIPALSYWGLISLFGLKSYLPFAAVLIAMHLGLAHLLWRASIRSGASKPVATALVAVFAVLGAGAENLVWGFQIAFVGAVAFGWWAILLHDHDGPFDRRDVLGWLAAIAALMCSGVAISLVGVAVLSVWLRRRRLLDAALVAVAPAAVFAGWYLVEGRHAPRPRSVAGGQWQVVDWAWRGLTFAAEEIVGIPGSGALLVLAILVWWGRHLELASGARSIAAAAGVGVLAFYLVTGLGRIAFGIDSGQASRYVYIAAALLLPSAALILTRSFPATNQSLAFLLGVCALVGFHNLGELRTEASKQMGQEQEFKGVVLASAQLLGDGRDHLNMDEAIDPRLNPDLTAADLQRIEGYDWLPSGEPTTAQLLTAETALDVAVRAPSGEPDAVRIGGDADIQPAEPRDGRECVVAMPGPKPGEVELSSSAPTWRVQVIGEKDETIGLRLTDGDAEGDNRSYQLPHRVSEIASAAADRTVVITLPAAGLELCGVTAAAA